LILIGGESKQTGDRIWLPLKVKISLERSVQNIFLELSSSEKIGEMAKKA